MDGDVTYIDIEENNPWWTNRLTGFRWESSFDADQVEYAVVSATEAITDTGSSCIVGPSGEVDYIVNTIINKVAETTTVYTQEGWGNIFACPAENDLPKFEFLFGGHWFEVLPEDYLVDASLA